MNWPPFSPATEALFAAAGWHRSSAAAGGAAQTAEQWARHILAQFGGLRVGETGPGRASAASDICFHTRPEPERCTVVEPWRRTTGPLASIATAHRQHMILFVDDQGACYAWTDPDGQLFRVGRSFAEAMDCVLLGMRYGVAMARDDGASPA